ncbi:hypothetical protein, partial [Pseudomonas savastanoi]
LAKFSNPHRPSATGHRADSGIHGLIEGEGNQKKVLGMGATTPSVNTINLVENHAQHEMYHSSSFAVTRPCRP